MNKVFQIIGTDGRVKETFTGTKEDALAFQALTHDTKFTDVVELKILNLAELEVESNFFYDDKGRVLSAFLTVSHGDAFVFEIMHDNGVFYSHDSEDLIGDLNAMKSGVFEVAPKTVASLGCFKKFFVCPDCNGEGCHKHEDEETFNISYTDCDCKEDEPYFRNQY